MLVSSRLSNRDDAIQSEYALSLPGNTRQLFPHGHVGDAGKTMSATFQRENSKGSKPKDPGILPKSVRSTRRPGQRGNALIEYAFTILIILTILFGIIDFGRALYTYHFISNAAREATRYASVRGATCDNATITPCPVTAREIENYVKNVPLGIDVTQLRPNPSANYENPNGLAVCNVTQNYPGCAIQVQVNYTFKFLFPLMPSNFTMSSTSQMIISR